MRIWLTQDQEAIERLRNYVPPPTAYGDLPLSRRAAVLLLLYADSKGVSKDSYYDSGQDIEFVYVSPLYWCLAPIGSVCWYDAV